ncbi:hypothetical protein ACLK7J_001755, partial [Campylobacter coli]
MGNQGGKALKWLPAHFNLERRNAPKSLITPDMTALWFEQQKMIEISELRREQFLEEITKEVIS